MTSTFYLVQYLSSDNRWKASNNKHALTAAEAFAFIAKVNAKYPTSTMRVVKSTKTDGLVNQEVVPAP